MIGHGDIRDEKIDGTGTPYHRDNRFTAGTASTVA
jgi:hypothetical protein